MSLSAKQLTVVLNENTLLSLDHVQLLLALYESTLANASSHISGSHSVDLQWSAISLRQCSDGQQANRLYMKLQL
jgi:hypothetical protein